MHTPRFRNLFNLSGKKVVIVIAFLLPWFLIPCQAQNQKRKSLYSVHLPDYDERTVHYGFFLAGHYTHFRHSYSDSFVNRADTTLAVSPKWAPGYGIGFIVSYSLDPQFDLALLPSFAYYERTLDYRFDRSKNSQTVESGFLELSVLMRYKSLRRGNVRMYMVGGVKPSVEIGSNKKEKGARQLRTNNTDLSIEYGAGFDLFYQYFKLSPELRFSHGLSDLLVKDENVFSRPIKKLQSHTVSLYLYF